MWWRIPSTLAALFSPDYIHHWGLGPDSIGVDDSIARITAYMQAIPDQRFTIEAVYGEGDVVDRALDGAGVQTGDLGVIAASSTLAEFSGINIFRIECGMIAETWNETDQLGRLLQQGVITDDELGSRRNPNSVESDPSPSSRRRFIIMRSEENVPASALYSRRRAFKIGGGLAAVTALFVSGQLPRARLSRRLRQQPG